MSTYKIRTTKRFYTISADSYMEARAMLEALERFPNVMSVQFISDKEE